MVIICIDLDSAEALEVVEFKLKRSALTNHIHFRRDKGKTATFFSFMLGLRNFEFQPPVRICYERDERRLILATKDDTWG